MSCNRPATNGLSPPTAVAPSRDVTGGYRAQHAVPPERFHGHQFIGDAVERANRGDADGQIAHLPQAECGDGAADGGDFPVLTEQRAVGDAQQARRERGVVADLAPDVAGAGIGVIDHPRDAQRHLRQRDQILDIRCQRLRGQIAHIPRAPPD